MKKLREIIQEAERTPERAKRFLDKLSNRRGFKADDLDDDPKRQDFVNRKQMSPLIPFEFERLSGWDKSYEEVPIHKIRSSQGTVSVEGVRKYVDNYGRGQYPEFSYNKHQDIYHIQDGNHRVSAARLLGKKTVRGIVWK